MFSDRWIVLPHFLTMMCGIEKNGITIQNKFAKKIQHDPNPYEKHVPWGLRFTCTRWKMSLSECRKMASVYRTIVVKRDPIERFVSAFKSKCLNADGDGARHCWKLFGYNATMHSVAVALSRKKSLNPHWAEQHTFCDGHTNYSICIPFSNITLLSNVFNRTDTEIMLKNKHGRHITNASTSDLSISTIKLLKRVYKRDFDWMKTCRYKSAD